MTQIDRRSFLRRSAAVTGGALAFPSLASVLAACGGDDSGSSGSTTSSIAGGSTTAAGGGSVAPADLGTFTFQFNWLNDVGWASSYLAKDAGVYEQQGFGGGAEFLYGGPNVAVEPLIVAGKCTMGLCNSETMAAAVGQGAPLKVVGAFMQTNPFCIVSMPDNPIATPADMVGKKIAVQALNDSLWAALLKINGIAEGDVTKVVAQYDPAPLINGEVDGFLSFVTNQNITVELQTGKTPTIMMLSDYGFTLYQQLYTVTEETLSTNRDAAVAGLRAEIIGRQMCAADPAKGVQLSLDEYSVDLNQDPAYATRALEETIKLGDTPTTQASGLLYMSAEDIAKNVETLGLLGLPVTADVYTSELLDEIFAAGPTLPM